MNDSQEITLTLTLTLSEVSIIIDSLEYAAPYMGDFQYLQDKIADQYNDFMLNNPVDYDNS